MNVSKKVTILTLALGLFVLALSLITTFVTAATVGLNVNSVFDNKNNKTYRAGGPDGADAMNDLNTTAEEWKFEIESGAAYWWEANYQDPPTNAGNPTKVVVAVNYRPEEAWAGTLRAEYRNGTTLLSAVNLPVNSSKDAATGKGQKGVYLWDVSSVVRSVQTLASGRVRFINTSTNGKKAWVSYSITTADYTVGTPAPTPTPIATPTPTPPPTATPTPVPTATPTPLPTGAITFAAIGDFGVDNSNELNVANLVKSWNPALVITLGDNNYNDGAASTIDQNIGKYYRQFIFPYTGSYGAGATTNRFWPSLGNHDWNLGNVNAHSNYFTLPNNERYYDFVQGPVHFFAIDSDGHEPDGTSSTSVQGRWLQSKLAASTAKWKIVYFHHPPYSSSSTHGSSAWMQWPFQQWGASAVLSGHDHTYERLDKGGFPYFVNGLGGRSRYAFGSALPESVVRYNSAHGAQRIEATNTYLTFTFYNTSGAAIDSFTLRQ